MNSKKLYKIFILVAIGIFSTKILCCNDCNKHNAPAVLVPDNKNIGNIKKPPIEKTNRNTAASTNPKITPSYNDQKPADVPSGNYPNLVNTKTTPRSAIDLETKGGGLPNLGNTCYMNSALQVLIRHDLVNANGDTPLDKTYQAIANKLASGSTILNSAVKALYKEVLTVTNFREGDQQDAAELMTYLFANLGVKNASFETQGSITCNLGHTRTIPKEENNILKIPVKSGQSMQNLVKTEMDLVDQVPVKCNTPGCTQVNTVKTVKFASIPQKLIVQLMRFEAKPSGAIKKIPDRVVDVETLVLQKEWMTAGLPEKDIIYDLVGVIMQVGSYSGGHYFSYIKEPSSDKWIECNDSSVSALANRAERESGYIFIYNRRV